MVFVGVGGAGAACWWAAAFAEGPGGRAAPATLLTHAPGAASPHLGRMLFAWRTGLELVSKNPGATGLVHVYILPTLC